MGSFFSSMNLARWIIVLSIVCSLGLGGVWYWLRGETSRLEGDLAARIPNAAQAMQIAAIKHTQLYGEFEREGLKGQSNPDEYIRVKARNEGVQLGGVDISAANPASPAKGIVDRKYTIRPQDPKAGHPRLKLANYMYLLEQESRRVKVTYVRLDPLEKHEPWQIGSDTWAWEIEVTSRQKQ